MVSMMRMLHLVDMAAMFPMMMVSPCTSYNKFAEKTLRNINNTISVILLPEMFLTEVLTE